MPGIPHHVTQRGNHHQNVFFRDSDRELYLGILRDNCSRHGLRVLAYCLMTNHVHLVLVPEDDHSLAKGLGRTHNDYARWIHVREQQVYGRTVSSHARWTKRIVGKRCATWRRTRSVPDW